MKLLLKTTVASFVLINASACSWIFDDEGTFRDRSNDYRRAVIEAPLELPESIESETMDDNFAIPEITDQTSLVEKFVLPAPEPLDEDVGREAVRISTFDDQRWILANGTPGTVWPRLRGFLSLNQLGVQRADATNGIIDTVWLQPSGEDTLRERYRLRIEQGVQRGSSEVYVLQADTTAGESWPKNSSSDEREQLIIQELAQYLADSATAATISMLAQQAIDSSGKVTLEEDAKGMRHIKLNLPFSRSWASVGNALKKAGFEIDDLNRSENIYYVHYISNNDKDKLGFFASLLSWNSKDDGKGTAYFIRVREQGERAATIYVDLQSGETMDENATVRILKLIKKHLS
jgi:outer membrane protein assembly factor BamC